MSPMRTRGLAALAVGLTLTGTLCYLVHADQRAQMETRFQRDTDKVARDTAARLQTCFDVLLGYKGIYALDDRIDRARFHRFSAELKLERRYPGFQAVQFVRAVPEDRLDAFVAAVRADTSVDAGGYPNFRVHPVTHAPVHYVIEYTAPDKGNENAFGLDLAALPPHLRAAMLARDSGEIVSTEPITLVQDVTGEPGFIARAPVYRNGAPVGSEAQRRDALVGFVALVFRVNALMREVIDGALLEHLHVRIEDGGYVNGAMTPRAAGGNSGSLLYDSAGKLAPQRADNVGLVAEKVLEVGQRRWLLRFEGKPGARYGGASAAVLAVALAGAIISVLAAGILMLRPAKPGAVQP
ncbi:CHASE domain-containing protein [Duganella phyllosphaerae]|nr:CHASE domain-containing protein [Duganella phyllosphaerae]